MLPVYPNKEAVKTMESMLKAELRECGEQRLGDLVSFYLALHKAIVDSIFDEVPEDDMRALLSAVIRVSTHRTDLIAPEKDKLTHAVFRIALTLRDECVKAEKRESK
ncbi:MAG: hypothetical protein V4486_02400 [Patescibacteria group bacterium]